MGGKRREIREQNSRSTTVTEITNMMQLASIQYKPRRSSCRGRDFSGLRGTLDRFSLFPSCFILTVYCFWCFDIPAASCVTSDFCPETKLSQTDMSSFLLLFRPMSIHCFAGLRFSVKYYKKLIRRWDSERELSLRRHCTRTKNRIDSCINSATDRFLQRRFTNFSEITQCNGITPIKVIQGHRFLYHSKAHIRLPISD